MLILGGSYRVSSQTGKPGEMGRHFPVREKSGNFEQTEKVGGNHTKYWKTQGIWDKYYLIFLVIFKWTVYYLLKWVKFSVLKKNKTFKKYWKNQWILSVRKSGNHVLCTSLLDRVTNINRAQIKDNTSFKRALSCAQSCVCMTNGFHLLLEIEF